MFQSIFNDIPEPDEDREEEEEEIAEREDAHELFKNSLFPEDDGDE